MKFLAIIASPRKNGNTQAVVERIAKKVKSLSNVEFEYVFLGDLNFGFCKGCCNCFSKGENFCPNQDDRIMLEQKLLSADAVIFASPVYAMNMGALMKNFMDRFAFSMHRPRFFNQKTMVVSVTGFCGLKDTLKSMAYLRYMGFDVIQSLGLVVAQPLENRPVLNEENILKIEKAAEKFYKKITSKKSFKPSLESIIQFRMQRKFYTENKEKLVPDWQYYEKNGWLNPQRKHYRKDVKIHPLLEFFASVVMKAP